jgi:hypothetical protein
LLICFECQNQRSAQRAKGDATGDLPGMHVVAMPDASGARSRRFTPPQRET